MSFNDPLAAAKRKVRQKEIKGKQVQIFMLPAFEGLLMAQKLAAVALPTLGAFYQGIASDNLNLENLSLTIVEEMADIEIQNIIVRLLKDVSVDGQPIDFDSYFMGNYGELIEIVTFAIQENFGSFFEARGLLEKFLPKVEKAQEPRQEEQSPK